MSYLTAQKECFELLIFLESFFSCKSITVQTELLLPNLKKRLNSEQTVIEQY